MCLLGRVSRDACRNATSLAHYGGLIVGEGGLWRFLRRKEETVKRVLPCAIVGAILLFGCATPVARDSSGTGWTDVYARCNIKVLAGNEITWINWQSSPLSIVVGAPLRVRQDGARVTVEDASSKTHYAMDLGSSRSEMLWKFFAKAPPNLSRFSGDERENILRQVAKVGMSKEAVYVAMGPPTNVRDASGVELRTNESTYEEILATDIWVYARRRFGKNIGVSFSRETGVVDRTEGIWGK
jgi:hypothetical protein